MLADAARADRYRRGHGHAHPRYGNGTLMSVAIGQAVMPPVGDRRFLAAQGAVIAAVLARLESLECHGGKGSADAGNVEERL